MTRVELTDGGRAAHGRKGDAGDCVTRAVAIATRCVDGYFRRPA